MEVAAKLPPASPPARGLRRALVAALLVVAGSVLAAGGLPFWMAGHGVERAKRCLDQAEAGEEPDPLGCVERARAWLVYPSLLPWTRQLTEDEGPLDPAAAARAALQATTAAFPDAGRRAAAAAAVRDAAGGAQGEDESAILTALDAGALEGVFPPGAGSPLARELSQGLRAAIARGDLVTAERLALEVDGAPRKRTKSMDPYAHIRDPWHCNLSESAAACLLGRRAEGQKFFASAECSDGFRTYPEQNNIRWLGVVACGSDAEGLEKRLGRPGDSDGDVARAFLAASSGGPRAGGLRAFFSNEKLPVAVMAALEDPTDPRRVRRLFLGDTEPSFGLPHIPGDLIAPLSAPALGCPSRRQHLDPSCFIAPALHDRAAARLDVLAEEAAPRDKVLSAELGRIAWILRALAAAEHLHRGDVSRAREVNAAIRARPARAPRADWHLVPVRMALAAGDPRGAIEAAAEARVLGAQGAGELFGGRWVPLRPAHEALLVLYEALAQLALGDTERAAALATQADERLWALAGHELCVPGLEDECREPAYRTPGFSSIRVRARWLRAALAWRAGRREEALQALPPGHPNDKGEPVAGAELLAGTLDLLRQAEGQRRRGRMNLPGDEAAEADWLTAAQMYLVGEAARGEGDVEVWLDRVFSRPTRSGGRAALRARAEAARWRGDAEAAQRWEARAATIQGWIVDDRSAALVRIAGL